MRFAAIILAVMMLSTGMWAQLPDAPKPITHDHHFLRMMGADAASSLADVVTSSIATKNPNCYETNLVYGNGHPTAARFALQMGLQTAAINLLGWELKRHHKWYWFAPALVDGEQHAIGAALTASHGCL